MLMICRYSGLRVMVFKRMIGMIMGKTPLQCVRRSRIGEQ